VNFVQSVLGYSILHLYPRCKATHEVTTRETTIKQGVKAKRTGKMQKSEFTFWLRK
jgi:hypothetical protein